MEARSALLATAADPFRGTMAAAHAGPVSAVAMSADGSVAASGGLDGTLRLWDVPHPAGGGPAGATPAAGTAPCR